FVVADDLAVVDLALIEPALPPAVKGRHGVDIAGELLPAAVGKIIVVGWPIRVFYPRIDVLDDGGQAIARDFRRQRMRVLFDGTAQLLLHGRARGEIS